MSVGIQTNLQSDRKTSDDDLLPNKVKYIEKELAICNSKLEKHRQSETNDGDSTKFLSKFEELLNNKLSMIDEKIEETVSRKLAQQPANSKQKIDMVVTDITKYLTKNEETIANKIDSALKEQKTYAMSVQENTEGGSLSNVPIINDFRSYLYIILFNLCHIFIS